MWEDLLQHFLLPEASHSSGLMYGFTITLATYCPATGLTAAFSVFLIPDLFFGPLYAAKL